MAPILVKKKALQNNQIEGLFHLPVKVFGTARLIPQSLQLKAQVTFSEPWLLSQVRKVCDVMYEYIIVFLK
jgi:hypothetical protein